MALASVVVTAEAAIAQRLGLAVLGVTARTGSVLRGLVEPAERGGLVTAATRGWLGDPLWPVGPVAVAAVRGDLAMGSLGLLRVTARAGLLASAAVRLVAPGARLMTFRCALMLRLVAAPAFLLLRSRVRLVAVQTG
jgi:hypothetical protein